MEKAIRSGFSLIELMIAIALAALLAAGIYRLLRSQARTSGSQADVSQNLRTSQRARALLTDDIAQAGFDPTFPKRATPVPIPPITAATNDHLALQGDFDMSGTLGDQGTTGEPETVTYQYAADTAQVTRNSQVILTDVRSFAFTYFDAAGGTVSGCNPDSEVCRTIKKVRTEWTQGVRDGKPVKEELTVTLRNFR